MRTPIRRSGLTGCLVGKRLSSITRNRDAPKHAGGREREMDHPVSGSRYQATYESWRHDPEAWWAQAAEGINWDRRWDRVFDPAAGPYGRWFPGARLNTAYNCLDRHVAAGRGAQPAIVWDSPVSGNRQEISYATLRDRVARVAGALARLGVRQGDR